MQSSNVVKDPHTSLPNQWLIKSCEEYNDEVKYCRSLRGKLTHRYIHGYKEDCSPKIEAMHNCVYWTQRGDIDNLKELISYEEQRLLRRKHASMMNNVWEYRTEPPSDWNSPLPEWAVKRAKEIGEYEVKDKDETSQVKKIMQTYCTIS
ncbi:unnamed protein product [Didymodactylos carnosus]|uniref:Synaptic plasticity regulator PANTS n=1 Tax=Didymodactylos carnosus TaxID=1234261 RepID=A0A813U2I4_9BILA|nr:unnamed protein product [Didymodactylos carnosus]CAF1291365.1 unnamed protein product [Didymodactylos carnosus]CAF3608854.1 unnamed protein product [Didymodactylos carnosus]CAF4096216.1 unnamed protein product [Didymodactylos carnosus]